MDITKIYNNKLPQDYLNFLAQHPKGIEVCFNEYQDNNNDYEGRYWFLWGEKELLKSWEMFGVGTTRNFECLNLYIKIQKEYSQNEETISNVGKISLERVALGFVVGTENGDYIYLDSMDDYSVWIYYHDGGDVLKITNSFKEFMNS